MIGDCLGVPFEFKNRGDFKCIDAVGGGAHGKPAWTWSDDTSMMLATLDAMKSGISAEKIYDNFSNWCFYGKYTTDGHAFDVGGTTYRAIKNRQGQSNIRDNGNGALMRILPFVFGDWSDDQITHYAGLTHDHPISHWCCLFYVHFARLLVKGVEKKKAYKKTCGQMKPKIPQEFSAEFENIFTISKTKPKRSGGYVVHTLECALWAILSYQTFKGAVLGAINLGEDTDTNGALTGGLAGILWGIPKGWKEGIEDSLKNQVSLLG